MLMQFTRPRVRNTGTKVISVIKTASYPLVRIGDFHRLAVPPGKKQELYEVSGNDYYYMKVGGDRY